jgi:hypothetical protein
MATVTLSATGPLPAAEAWERYALPRRWPEWSPQISRVELPEERIAPGLQGRLHAPGGFTLRFTIDAVDEAARTWSWTVRVALLRLRLDHWVEEGPGGGSTAGLRTDGPGPVIAAYAPVAQIALDRLVRPLGET